MASRTWGFLIFRILREALNISSTTDKKENCNYELSSQVLDPAWDSFVSNTPGGDHLQSSLWAAFKAHAGWRPLRIVVRTDGGILGGVQLLVRQMFHALKVAYVAQGPVIPNCESVISHQLLDILANWVRSERIDYLLFEPGYIWSPDIDLKKWGFKAGRIHGGQRASLLLDLRKGTDELLRQMRRTTRNNIGTANALGIEVREGGEQDLGVFHQLLQETGKRRKFTPESHEYFARLWNQLGPAKHVKLFLAEHKGVVLSGLLIIMFGDTVVGKRFAWGGSMKRFRPNELLYWRVIEWAKANGFQRFDFDGIDMAEAVRVARASSS